MEGKDAVTQSGGGGGDHNADGTDDAALGAAPAGHFTDTGQNILKHGQHGGHGGKDHEQEEDGAPKPAAVHVVKNGCHGVKQQAGTGADFQTEREAGGENDETSGDRHKGIQKDDIHGFAQQGAFLANIAAKNSHGADAETQGEECLIHCTHHHTGGDLGKVGQEIESKALFGAGKPHGVDGQNHHQTQQRHHHILRDPLQTALQVEAEDGKSDDDHDDHKEHIHTGIGDHGHKSQIRGLTDEEPVEIIQDPTGDHGVKGHQTNVAEQCQITVDMPFLSGLLKLLIHTDGTCLGSTAQGELHHHDRESQQKQADDINQDKPAAAVLAGHPRKFPDIAAADGAARTQEDKSQPGGQTLAMIHKRIPHSS